MKQKYLKIIKVSLVFALTIVTLSACDHRDNYIFWSDITSIEGAKNHAVTLEIGQTVQLSAYPKKEEQKWYTSNPKVATVTQNGLVEAIGTGEAIISVYPATGGNGNYVIATVIHKSIMFVDDHIDQSEAE